MTFILRMSYFEIHRFWLVEKRKLRSDCAQALSDVSLCFSDPYWGTIRACRGFYNPVSLFSKRIHLHFLSIFIFTSYFPQTNIYRTENLYIAVDSLLLNFKQKNIETNSEDSGKIINALTLKSTFNLVNATSIVDLMKINRLDRPFGAISRKLGLIHTHEICKQGSFYLFRQFSYMFTNLWSETMCATKKNRQNEIPRTLSLKKVINSYFVTKPSSSVELMQNDAEDIVRTKTKGIQNSLTGTIMCVTHSLRSILVHYIYVSFQDIEYNVISEILQDTSYY